MCQGDGHMSVVWAGWGVSPPCGHLKEAWLLSLGQIHMEADFWQPRRNCELYKSLRESGGWNPVETATDYQKKKKKKSKFLSMA